MNTTIQQLIDFDVRYEMFKRALRFVDYELIEGDILEFGVYTGRSLALLSHAHQDFITNTTHKVPFERKIVGFDSFKGLPVTDHPRWTEGLFSKNHSWHPFLNQGDEVNEGVVKQLFTMCELPEPEIKAGFFKNTLPYDRKIAVIHIDCDLFEPTLDILRGCSSQMQQGTIILFDDWFNYRADANKGEQLAFRYWMDVDKKWKAIQWQPYATYCNSFIICQ